MQVTKDRTKDKDKDKKEKKTTENEVNFTFLQYAISPRLEKHQVTKNRTAKEEENWK